ncbi:M16 family metallopeptidase [Alkalicaulis satelles]|nr:M16 family metallopeptidase [Alkalicaulis satelles]
MTGRALLALALACGLLALSGCERHSEPESDLRAAFEAADFPHEASDIPADPGVRYGVLDNGMRYAIMANATPSNTAAVRLVLNVGSLSEDEDQRGLAHFIEHMAFKGTTNVPQNEMVRLLERYGLAFGPDTNAFTGHDLVGYQLNLPQASEELLGVALFLMRETASELLFLDEEIESERGVILGEERFRNTPVNRFFSAYFRFLYPDTLVPERDPIGTVDVIETAPREAFVRYYEAFYRPERAILVVTGDFDPDLIEAKIRNGFDISIPGLDVERVESFETWTQPGEPGGDPEIGAVTRASEPQFGFFHDPGVVTLIAVDMIAPGPAALDTRAAREEAMLRQLGQAIVQRRLQAQINRGDAPLVQANLSHVNQFGLANRAGVFAVSSPDRWREGVAMVEQELRRALEHGFTRSELDEQMANTRTALRNGADQAGTRQTTSLADSIWSAWLRGAVFNHPEFARDWFEALEPSITPGRVEAAFRRAFEAAPPHVMVALNQDLAEGEAAVREAWLASTAERVDPPAETDADAFAYDDFGPAGQVIERTELEEFGVTQMRFANGVRLNVKPTDFESRVVRVRVDFGAGDMTDQPVPAAGSILGAAFGGGGLEAHDRDALQRLLAGRSVSYGLGVGSESFFFSNATTPSDFELQMQVLAAFMTAPGWREDGLNQFRAIAEEVRRGQNAQAVQVAINRGGRVLRGGDPRFGFPTAEEVAGFTMDHARQMLAPALAEAPVEITIVGDVTVERAMEVTAATFGALPERAESWPEFDHNRQISFPEPAREPVVLHFDGQDYQGMANVYFPIGDGFDARRRRALQLMAGIFDLKATERFREREGATYSPIVQGQPSTVYPGFGFVWAGLDVAVSDISRMYEIVDEIAGVMASGEITEDELQRARQPVLERLREQRERNPFWIGALARSQSDPDRLEDLRTAEAHYREVTVEEITALAREALDPGRAFRMTILPRSLAPLPEDIDD